MKIPSIERVKLLIWCNTIAIAHKNNHGFCIDQTIFVLKIPGSKLKQDFKSLGFYNIAYICQNMKKLENSDNSQRNFKQINQVCAF